MDVVLQSPNFMTKIGDWFVWDVVYIFREVLRGITLARNKYGKIDSIGVATWGVDFGLFSSEGVLLNDVLAYRNEIGGTYFDKLSEQEKKTYFELTGILSDKINSAYLLQGVRDKLPTVYKNATRLLMISDILNYYLTGTMINEPSMLSTTQLLDVKTQTISKDICHKFDLRSDLFGEISNHGESIGFLKPEIIEELQLDGHIPVISIPSHDTAAAVLAVPALPGERFAFLSSGTWSLLGMELDDALINEKVFEGGFTNEIGAFGKITLLKNNMGLFLLQRLKQEYEFEQGKVCTWDEFYSLRSNYKNRDSLLFDVNAREFFNPISMLDAILNTITDAGAKVIPSEQKWDIAISAAIESLACSYAIGVEKLESATCKKIDKIYVVGGGTRDRELNQLTANSTGRPVILGSPESTSLGNILAQSGYLAGYSIEKMRSIVRNSYPPLVIETQNDPIHNDVVRRYRELIE